MRIVILAIIVLFSQDLYAQNDSTATKGEVLNGEVIIEKEKKITLPKADKVFKKADLKSFNSEALNLSFQVSEPTFDWPGYKSDVPFQRVNKKYPLAEYQSFVKLGFGNYSSPLLEAAVFQQVGKLKLSSGLLYESFARGPINKEFSSSSNVRFNLAATYQGKGFSVTPYFGIANQLFKFYGNTNRNSTGFSSEAPKEGLYNQLIFGSRLSGRKKGLEYSLDAQINNASQNLKGGILLNKEPSVQATGGLSLRLDTTFTVGFDIEGYSSNYQSGISYDRSLFKMSPWGKYDKNNLMIAAGFRVGSSNSFNTTVSGFYPFANVEWEFRPEWSVYTLIDGGLDWNSLNLLLSENQFLDDSLLILNPETTLKVGGGVKGSISKNLKVNLDIAVSSAKYFSIYIPSDTDSTRFTIITDNSTFKIGSLAVGAEYTLNSRMLLGTQFKYFLYGHRLDFVQSPWHLPDFQFSGYFLYNFQNKLIFSVNNILLTGLQSPIYSEFGLVNLPTIWDLSLGIKYLITNRSSVFFTVDNLFSNNYERYVGYPVRGLTFKIGGKYRF